MSNFDEATITIDGEPLTLAQSMTLRVALASFLMDIEAHGLGEDKIGKEIAEGYLRNGRVVATLIGNSIKKSETWK
jgi:hypothetical protein